MSMELEMFRNRIQQAAEEAQRRYREGMMDWLMSEFGFNAQMAKRALHDPNMRKQYDEYLQEQERKTASKEREEALRRSVEEFDKTTPTRYSGAKLSDFRGFPIESRMRMAVKSDESWLVLGSNGVGKTRLAYAMCRVWAGKGESYAMVTATRLSAEIRNLIMSGADVCEELQSRYGFCRHLIIDEIDKMKGNENDMNNIGFLIDYRYSYCRQTIIFGNLYGKKPEDILSASILSRMKGDGAVPASLWNGKDRRTEA